jgi:hypothetical protein
MSTFSKWKERLTRQAGKAKAELHRAEPTYPAGYIKPVEEARQKLDQLIDEFIQAAAAWNAAHAQGEEEDDEANPFKAYVQRCERGGLIEAPPPPVHAMRASTGIGKTQRFAARLARHIKATAETRPWLYLAPTHRLNEDTAKYFRERGLTAKVYRGRDAVDPSIPGSEDRPKHDKVRMCLEREKVALAKACKQSIDKACCKNKNQQCASYDKCGYQRQLRGDQPQVWLAAHNMLYHPQKVFGDVAGVVVDETFYQHGIYGVESRKRDEEDKKALP